MRKIQIVGILTLMLVLMLSACVQATPVAQQPTGGEQEPACEPAVESPPLLRPGVLIMSTNATIPPYQFIDDQGNLRGMRIDLGEEIAQRLCLEPEWVNIQFEAQIPGLQGDRWDMINTGLFFTEERSEIMELVPYELQAVSISVPIGNPDNIQSTEDLAGMTVAVEVAGYEETQIRRINEEQVDEGLESMDIRTFNTFADAYQALRAGQVGAVVSVDVTAKFYEDQGEFERVISGLAGTAASLAFKSPELAEAVAGVLEDMKADGTYDELFEEWGATKIDDWENWPGEFRVY